MVNITECSTKDCNNMSIDGIDGRCNECLQPILEVEEPDKEGGITFIFKDNRFMFIKAADGKIETVSIPE